MNFIERIAGMVIKPDDTTKDIEKDPRIEEGLMIVGVYMIISVLGAYLSVTRIRYTGSVQGMDASMMNTIMLAMAIGGTIVAVLVGWPIVTGAVHVLSMFFGANGKFYPTMMTLIGYTAIPLIILTVIAMVLTMLSPVTVIDLSGGAQAATSSAASSILSPLALVSIALTLLASAWTAYMMAFAAKNGEKLSFKNSLIVVGVLFVLNLLITYGSTMIAILTMR